MDLEKLEQLPKKESRKEYITRIYGDMWDVPRFDHPWMRSDKSDYSYVKAERIIKKYLGKSFDKAFSEYCKIVPKHEQKDFLDFFNDRHWRSNKYKLDSQKRIQLNPERYKKKKYSITFRSFDCEYGYYNVVTKESITLKQIALKNVGLYGWNRNYYEFHGDYIYTILSGYTKTFESRKDPEYKRLMAEKIDAEKRNKRLLKKEAKEKYNFKRDE